MSQYRELFDYTYTVEPTIQVYPPLYPGRNRVALDIYEGYVSADGGTIAAATAYTLTTVRSSDCFDLASGTDLKILVPGYYEIEFELNVTGSHQLEIYEAGIGLGVLAQGPVVAATNRTKLTASVNDNTVTVADPLIIRFRALSQATGNATTATGSRIVVRRVGEIVAL